LGPIREGPASLRRNYPLLRGQPVKDGNICTGCERTEPRVASNESTPRKNVKACRQYLRGGLARLKSNFSKRPRG